MPRQGTDATGRRLRGFSAALLILCVSVPALSAQSATFKGRILADSTERPLAGVTVVIDALKLEATSDSLGRFSISGVKPGAHLVTVRRIGLSPLTTHVQFNAGATVDADLLMVVTGVQALPDVKVVTKAPVTGKLAEFEERRLAGQGGRFLTQADLEKHPYAVLSNALRQVPGLQLIRQGSQYFVAAGRSSLPGGTLARGGGGRLPPPCPAAIMLDGTMVYGAGDVNLEQKFSIDQINLGTLAGIEYYAGPASIPVKYNATRGTCGLLILWTK